MEYDQISFHEDDHRIDEPVEHITIPETSNTLEKIQEIYYNKCLEAKYPTANKQRCVSIVSKH